MTATPFAARTAAPHTTFARALAWSTLVLLCAALLAASPGVAAEERERAIAVLESVPLFDGHNDVPWQYRNRVDYRLSEMDFRDTTDFDDPRPMHTDLQRLREGRVGAQWWSVYVAANIPEDEAVKQTLEHIDFVHRLVEAYP